MHRKLIHLSYYIKAICVLSLLISFSSCSILKHSKKKTPVKPGMSVQAKKDSTASAAKKLTPYKDIVGKNTKTQKGLFTVHYTNEKYYFEIPDSIMGRDMLVVTRFHKNVAGSSRYAGEEINEQTIRLEKGPSNKVFLRIITYINIADTTENVYKAVEASSVNPIMAAFDIKSLKPDTTGVVIEVTDFLKGDNQLLSFDSKQKKNFGINSLASDRSYIAQIKSFPINTEVRTVKTFNASPSPESEQIPAAIESGVITVELNNSFILLPKIPMQKRLYDPRVGFFASQYQVYTDDQQKLESETFIRRWRLLPKAADWDKWKKGELVEPEKPIVYYIDPAMPKKYVPYIIQGVNDWQKVFEKIGFKNAIMGKEWPESDTTMSMEDARFSVIRYLASPIPNAYGPHVADPRSGEIIESHIGWYHNIMQLVNNWYMIQAGVSDTGARKMVFSDSLMGQLLQFVAAHEVGHTLGLRHNMGSSSLTPVEKLRDKKWLQEHGHTVSIMDYARFNYVAQPEDNIPRELLFPKIGEYDYWAIKWGYNPMPEAANPEAESKILNKLYIDSIKSNPYLWFGGEGMGNDPRSQTEDLGNNSMLASEYGIKNLKRVIVALPDWTYEENDKYENLSIKYRALLDQYNRYMFHVSKNIGGVYFNPKSVDEKGDIFAPVSKGQQKEALAFLDKQLFQTPEWLLNKNIINKISTPETNEMIESIQQNVLSTLLSSSRLMRMATTNNRFEFAGTYSPLEFMADIKLSVWKELKTNTAISYYRRNLQKKYVNLLADILNPAETNAIAVMGSASRQNNLKNSDITSIIRANLVELKREIIAAIPTRTDKISQYHLQDILAKINQALDPAMGKN